jgi:transposase-like protein
MEMPLCPSLACSLPVSGPKARHVIRSGFFKRKRQRGRIQRYRCISCGLYFSSQTLHSTYRQRRPDLNFVVRDLLCSQVTQRRCAKLLNVSCVTVVRKFRFMARQAAIASDARRKALSRTPLELIQFDDLVTSIHTKCKPASVSLAVNAITREILGVQVSRIPARHPLAEISLKKYGPRRDDRPIGLGRLFNSLVAFVHPKAHLHSDRDPAYIAQIFRYFPSATHQRTKARRGRSEGFGELKRIGFDPLFSLNHTCAMLRANLNRLARRTWSTTKTETGLLLHLELYAHYHNAALTRITAF